jgi:aminobenzoyl-glutamate utilization protein B
MLRRVVGSGLLVLAAAWAGAGESAGRVLALVDQRHASMSDLAMRIWELAEVGYQEQKSSLLLQDRLETAGFSVEAGQAGMPTAFIASYGTGTPVVAILAEYDALPGLSQAAVPERSPLEALAPGHGCGHHLFGSASAAAAIAVRDWMETSGAQGTLRVYGTPAEEGGGGKVYMVRAGLFEDVDAVLAWHPSDRNDASPRYSLANISGKFRFRGVSAHAAGAPEQGRSALDGVEAMNGMVNMLREHVDAASRIHYVITHGGLAPNVVPDFAEVYYYCRHTTVEVAKSNWERIIKAAEGAAIGTGTTVELEVIHGLHNMLPNEVLGRLLETNLRRVGGFVYSDEEIAFSKTIQATLASPRPIGAQENVEPWNPRAGSGSTDVADISWVVPTAEFVAATWVPGTPAHSWQAVAAGGTSIGFKGMKVATKTLALTALELFEHPELLEKAKQELLEGQGVEFQYEPLVGDRQPPLDYRN